MSDDFLRLTNEALRTISLALRSGRLSAPYTAVSLRAYCPDVAGPVAARMQQLHLEGMSWGHLALMLASIAQAREEDDKDSIDLVWSGPAVHGLASRGTGTVVRELFYNAGESVLLAGYAVYQGQEVFRSLAERMEEVPALTVRMFLDIQRKMGDTAPEDAILAEFAWRFREKEWPGGRLPEVFYDPRSLSLDPGKRSSLHAKCVVADRRIAFVSSANFTEAAQERNIEAGVLIRSESFASSLANHFETLAAQGILLLLPLEKSL
jgi:phosphatidylserine/phosphatidylglycerophosphate/cardiolipin synthase-like enzyme